MRATRFTHASVHAYDLEESLRFYVDVFEAAYRIATKRGLFDRDAWSPNARVLNDGAVQMYLRDPAGNLVEVNWPDVTTLDRSVVTALRPISDERPQSAEAHTATLYPRPLTASARRSRVA